MYTCTQPATWVSHKPLTDRPILHSHASCNFQTKHSRSTQLHWDFFVVATVKEYTSSYIVHMYIYCRVCKRSNIKELWSDCQGSHTHCSYKNMLDLYKYVLKMIFKFKETINQIQKPYILVTKSVSMVTFSHFLTILITFNQLAKDQKIIGTISIFFSKHTSCIPNICK